LNIGISAGAPGGKKQLGLLPTAVSRTGVANGTQYVFSFPAASLSGLQVADLKHCSISLAPDPQIVDQNPDATRERIFFHGLELIANTVSILADYDMAISLSTVNTSFQFTVPTPHYNIVGGRVRVTKNNSTQPWIEISQWGDRTSNEKQFYSGRCWSQQYGNDSYYYVTLYVSPFGTGTNPTHEAKVIGGRKQATNNTSTAPWVETNIWGERAGQEFTIGSGRAWSDAYPSNESYQYASLFVAPAPTGSLNRGPRVVGWRVQVSNDNSTAPRIETGFTGERTSYEVQVAEGYCWSSQYGNDSYFYATFYVDRPVFQTPDANVEKTVVLRSLKCITPSETSWYDDDKDEIYIKAVGQRFPRTGNMPMAAGDSMFINLQTALTVTSESSENVEVWDADIVSSDDKLYIFHLSATSLWKASDGSVHQLQLCSPGRYTSSAGRLEDCLYQLEIEVR
jgi:hypothetical protein